MGKTYGKNPENFDNSLLLVKKKSDRNAQKLCQQKLLSLKYRKILYKLFLQNH